MTPRLTGLDEDASVAFSMEGATGTLRHGARRAAALGPWTLVGSPREGGWTVTATPLEIDEFWMNKSGPFKLILDVGTHQWVWDNVEIMGREPLTLTGHGRPERR